MFVAAAEKNTRNLDATPAVETRQLTRRFGAQFALESIDLTIRAGEFFSLLGPSGSGKTTCLRLIAGFDRPTSGEIYLNGVAANHLPPYARKVNTVFQDYALFPHMSVVDNVAYGPLVKGVASSMRNKKALELLEMVQLAGFADRKPNELSGGQKQRVALARALINEPPVILLDEPLGALDLKMRESMQHELKELQKRLGVAFIYVTHDQGEAMAMSDRVAVFNRGKIAQLDTPDALYNQPRTAFVANFVGTANLLNAMQSQHFLARQTPCALRPERLALQMANAQTSTTAELVLPGTVSSHQFYGGYSRYNVVLSGPQTLTLNVQTANYPSSYQRFSPGDAVQVLVRQDAIMMLEEE